MIGSLVELIWRYIPPRVRAEMVRTFQNKFTVSVVGIVFNPEQKVLVLEHYFRPKYQWGFPGGFINRMEDSQAALERELFEETGIRIEDAELIHVRTIGKHVEIVYVCRSNSEAKVASREIKDLGWFAVNELPNVSPAHISLLKLALRKLKVDYETGDVDFIQVPGLSPDL